MMKSVILWKYERGTIQYDVFCLMIIAFIFFTPKTWFDTSNKIATRARSNHVKVQSFSPADAFVKNSKGISSAGAVWLLSPDNRESKINYRR